MSGENGLEQQADSLQALFQSIFEVEWLSTALTVAVVLVITYVVSRLAAKLLRKILSHDNLPIPSSSIFINIARVIIWVIGLSVVLSSCFNVDVSAAITALGVGGIAISLGFQDTLSNLIGGIQVSITGVVEPGDNIEVGGQRGIVRDVTWRHTTIENTLGERVVIPNSIINTTALVKLRPLNVVSIPLVVTVSSASLTDIAREMEEAAAAAAGAIVELEVPPRALFAEVTDFGYRGTLTFTVKDADQAAAAKDAALRAVAPYAHK